jgi:hypothetical protein
MPGFGSEFNDDEDDVDSVPRACQQNQSMQPDSNPTAGITIDYERIVQEFLTGIKLRKVLAHMCNHALVQLTDPISDVVCTMLTCPVQMVVSEVGCHSPMNLMHGTSEE